MADEQTPSKADELVAEVESGARNPQGAVRNLIPILCFIWAVYQLYISSPLPSDLTVATGVEFFQFIGNLSISRKIHLAFALALATLAFPLYRSAPRDSGRRCRASASALSNRAAGCLAISLSNVLSSASDTLSLRWRKSGMGASQCAANFVGKPAGKGR